MKILHIINSLKKGGAEGNLFRLCISQKKKYKKKIQISIITLIDDGYYESRLRKIGVKIKSLKFSNENNFFKTINKIKILRKLIIKENPDLVQSWMYHSNFISIFIRQIYKKKIFWNIRHSELNLKISKITTIIISLISGLFSRLIPAKIIYCSKKSINFHEKKHFYSAGKSALINNGFSQKDYFSSKSLSLKFKKKFKLKKTDIVIGFAGRYAKQKNILSLIRAFSLTKTTGRNIYLFMAGKNINYQNTELVNQIKKFEINKSVFLLDEQKSLVEFYNGIDFLVLPSHSESFPNVIAECMLCATPVISSKAGCAQEIVSNQTFILNNNDYITIHKMLKKIISIKINHFYKWKKIEKYSRLQIMKKYSTEQMEKNYINTWTF